MVGRSITASTMITSRNSIALAWIMSSMDNVLKMNQTQTIEVPIAGMDCAECTQTVQHAITSLNGIKKADVFLSSEKAIIQLDPSMVKLTDIRNAVKNAGYSIPEQKDGDATP